jgi:dUTP pyrophosphatase
LIEQENVVIQIKILNKSDNPTPEYKSEGAAGFDIATNEDVTLTARQAVLISTGLYVVIPKGYEGQLRLRSSMYQSNMVMPNAPGTIDSDYRGEIKVALLNTNPYCSRKVKKGERIAQMVINKLPEVGIEEISEEEFKMPQNLTIRNSKGFGSTGRN